MQAEESKADFDREWPRAGILLCCSKDKTNENEMRYRRSGELKNQEAG